MRSWRRQLSVWISAWTIMSFVASVSFAGNPWSRTVGPAIRLYDSARAIERRTEDLECHGYAHRLSIQLVRSTSELKENIHCGAEWNRLEGSLHEVESLQEALLQTVAARCSLNEDRRLRFELERFMDRLCDMQKELRKCRAAIPLCHVPGPPAQAIPSYRVPAHVVPWESSPSELDYREYRSDSYPQEFPMPMHHESLRPRGVPMVPPIPSDDPRFGPSIQVRVPPAGRVPPVGLQIAKILTEAALRNAGR